MENIKMKKTLMKTARLSALLLTSVGFSQATLASTIIDIEIPEPLSLTITSTIAGHEQPHEKTISVVPLTTNENGSYSSNGSYIVGNEPIFEISWEMEYRANPYIFSNFTITNFSSSASTFSLSALLPTGSFATATKGGSIGYTLTDENSDGTATLSGSPTYRAFVDGTQELALLGVSDTCLGTGCISTSSAKDGVASLVTSATSKPVTTSLSFTDGITTNMGIDLDFTLSAGDKVTFESYFQVTPVPVPAAGWLMLTGLGFLTARKRRTISA